MKSILHYRASPGFRETLEALRPDWLEIAVVEPGDEDGLAAEIGDCEALLHVLEPVTREFLAAAPRLRLIQKIGVGVDTIDLDAARARDVAVANMPGTNSQAVAEMALALMLATLRRIVPLDAATRAGAGWRMEPEVMDDFGELAGRVVGLVGYGRVARLLARMLSAIGAEVVAHDPAGVDGGDAAPRSLSDLLRESDVVSLHAPLTPANARMMDAQAFAAMKPGSVLVNTARGGLVDETALVEALRSGHLRGAGLDVFEIEPAPADRELHSLDRVVVTPHVAWLTPETLSRSLEFALENCRRARDGEEILNRVA